MSRRKKRQGHGPRRHRLQRPASLASARDWMASGARVTIRTYAKWFGLDRYTAYDELTMLGVSLSSGDLNRSCMDVVMVQGSGQCRSAALPGGLLASLDRCRSGSPIEEA